jgi:hypothetical protein
MGPWPIFLITAINSCSFLCCFIDWLREMIPEEKKHKSKDTPLTIKRLFLQGDCLA